MKAFKIDVEKKEISEIEIQKGSVHIYKVLNCDTFDVIVPTGAPAGLSVYIDDEGLYREPALGAFSIRGYPQVLSGHGLVLGTNKKGDSTDAPTTLEQLKVNVRFEDTHYLPEPSLTFIST